MRAPEMMVTMIEVYFGRRPKRVILFLPTLEPILSPRKAMSPPMLIRTRTMAMPMNIVTSLPYIIIRFPDAAKSRKTGTHNSSEIQRSTLHMR